MEVSGSWSYLIPELAVTATAFDTSGEEFFGSFPFSVETSKIFSVEIPTTGTQLNHDDDVVLVGFTSPLGDYSLRIRRRAIRTVVRIKGSRRFTLHSTDKRHDHERSTWQQACGRLFASFEYLTTGPSRTPAESNHQALGRAQSVTRRSRLMTTGSPSSVDHSWSRGPLPQCSWDYLEPAPLSAGATVPPPSKR